MMQLVTFGNYFWARKTLVGASHYAWCSTITVIIACVEVSMLQYEGYRFVDGVFICLSLVSFVSQTSYNQAHLFISYLVISAYIFIRTYLHSLHEDMDRYLRFNILFVISLILIYISARKCI